MTVCGMDLRPLGVLIGLIVLLLAGCARGVSDEGRGILSHYQTFAVQSSQVQGAQLAAHPNLPQRAREVLESELVEMGLQPVNENPQLLASFAIGVVHTRRGMMDRYGIGLRTGVDTGRHLASEQGKLRFSLRLREAGEGGGQIAFGSIERSVELENLDKRSISKALRRLFSKLDW